MKILFLDIETAPTTAYVWGMWEQNVGMNQIVKPGYVLSYAAHWLNSDEVLYNSIQRIDKRTFLQSIHELLTEADVVVHYNGKKFDIPTINREFVLEGMLPPANYKQIDLLTVVRKHFKFPHNKLDYVSRALGCGGKLKHAGFEMWVGCMNGDQDAWQQMQEYNIEDVVILERLYRKLLPWINNHPNHGLYADVADVCPNCGGVHLQRRGYSYTAAGKYQRYQCNDCGSWSRSKKTVAVKGILGNAV